MGVLTLISVSSPALLALEGNRYRVDALPTIRYLVDNGIKGIEYFLRGRKFITAD
jgi:hypothetical protein